jgi:DNA-binding SARP family transcriptional activator
VDIRVLGPFEVDGATGPVDIRGPKRRGLFALLVAYAGDVISRDRIIDSLWGDAVEGADHTVQTYVSQLRKLVDADVRIETVGRGYRLVADRSSVDVARFTDTADLAAAEQRADERRALLQAALAQWRGSPLEEFAGTPWADAFAQRLEQRRLEVLEQRIDADLALGRSRELIGELEELVRAYPLAEPLWAQRMLALYRCGRQGDALRAYADLRSILAEDLGIEPSRALAELELRILDQDQALLELDGQTAGTLVSQTRPPPELPTGTVTFLLTDIVSSTELWDEHPAQMAAAVREHESMIESVIGASGGHFLKHRGEGDSTLSVFDRAVDALEAAVAIRDRFLQERDTLALPLTIRTSLHTGEVEQRDSDYFGTTVNRAARIRALASADEILCSRATAELVADALPESVALIELGALRLRGLQRNEVVYRVVARGDDSARGAGGRDDQLATDDPGERAVRVDLHDESVLVAREAELDRLTEMFAAATSGRPGVLFLRGDAGVGKTRLLHAFVEHSGAELPVHLITCSPQGAAARVALADLVRRASTRADDPEADVVGLLEGRFDAVDDTAIEVARLRRLTVLRDAIRSLSRDGPALVVIEDVHWAEPGFIELVEFVAQDLLNQRADLPLLLVITRRTFAVPAEIEAVLARLERLPLAKTMTLRPLREVDIDDLVRAYGVDPPGRLLVHVLYERSRGNPLYVREALRRIGDLDGFVVRGGRIETRIPPTEFGAPADLRELVTLRLRDLPDEVLDALALASIAGFEFDPQLVDRVGAAGVHAHLETAAKAGLLSETLAGYQFTHPIIHAAVYDAVPPDRRRLHHRTLAAAIEHLPEERRAERLLEFANHVLEGGLDDAPPHVARDLAEAGRRAAALAEWGEAARCYDGAIAIATRTGMEADGVAWLHFASGQAHERHYDSATAERKYWSALALGRESDNRELWGRAALALAMRTSVSHPNAAIGDYDENAWNALVDALEHVSPELPHLRAEMLCKYAEMRYQRLEVPDGLVAAAEAVEMARLADSAELLVVCQSNLAYGYLTAGDASAAFAVLDGVHERIESDLNPQDQGFALARLALAYFALGRLEEALRTSHDAFVVFDAGRHQSGASLVQTIAADVLLRCGDRKEGERRANDAARLYRISEYSQVPPVLYAALVAARSADGDYAGARAALDDWQATGQRGQGLARALLEVRTGAVEDPGALAERARRMMASAATPSIVQIGRLGALAEIAAALRLPDLAREVLVALDGRVTSDVVFAPGFPFHAFATRAVALETLRDPAAEAAYREALDALTDAGVEPERSRMHSALGRLLRLDHGREAS